MEVASLKLRRNCDSEREHRAASSADDLFTDISLPMALIAGRTDKCARDPSRASSSICENRAYKWEYAEWTSRGGVFNGRSIKHLTVMSMGMLLATYFQTLAARLLDAIILYPTVNALSLIAGGLMSSLLFKERLTWRCILGTAIVFFALMLSRL